jgi:hypothetical protein
MPRGGSAVSAAVECRAVEREPESALAEVPSRQYQFTIVSNWRRRKPVIELKVGNTLPGSLPTCYRKFSVWTRQCFNWNWHPMIKSSWSSC